MVYNRQLRGEKVKFKGLPFKHHQMMLFWNTYITNSVIGLKISRQSMRNPLWIKNTVDLYCSYGKIFFKLIAAHTQQWPSNPVILLYRLKSWHETIFIYIL